ncbi:DUF1573 domain-containing protein [Flavobacterium sp.]|uniref:DUF1573 domain-containing protein n=1 Tax=Flavobacterium sp. TaxID=239 RepID=UPI002627173E|nr:DUF1573 domain-containing protein [Flavobacterium sp.]
MKILKISMLALALGLMSFTVISNEENTIVKTTEANAITWKSDVIEVGQIPQGTPKLIEFQFKNTSSKAVVITNVKPACGCTAADYTKESIAPGKSGYVKATYNAAAAGPFTKTVTVTTSAETNPKVLTFKGTVVAKS